MNEKREEASSEALAPMDEASAKGSKRLMRNPYFIAAMAVLIGWPIFRFFIVDYLRHVPEPPPVLGQLPAYELVNQDGLPFGSADLAGEVYVANVFFTTCPSICPTLMKAAKDLETLFEKHDVDVKMVSITVDPANDTPEVLKAHAADMDVNGERWVFLTGPEDAIRALVLEGFQTHVGEREKNENDMWEIAHSAQFILIDDQGQVRGYYDSDESGIDEVYHRAQHVLAE